MSIFPSANILGDCQTKRLTAQLLIGWKLAWEWRGWQRISSSTNNSTDTTKSSPYLRLFHIFLRLRIRAGKMLWHANVHLWSAATLCQSPTLHYAHLTQRIPHKSKHSSIALTFLLQISETKKFFMFTSPIRWGRHNRVFTFSGGDSMLTSPIASWLL